MYVCNDLTKECNTVREPVCDRGGPVTAYSVEGTGPGAACKPPKEPPVEPPPEPSIPCLTRIKVGSGSRIVSATGNITRKVC